MKEFFNSNFFKFGLVILVAFALTLLMEIEREGPRLKENVWKKSHRLSDLHGKAEVAKSTNQPQWVLDKYDLAITVTKDQLDKAVKALEDYEQSK